MSLLIDAGADVTSAFQFKGARRTPLAWIDYFFLCEKGHPREEEEITLTSDEELGGMEATRRLLLRVDAVHAVSWLWRSNAVPIAHAAVDDTSRIETTPIPLTLMLPILRRRAGRPRVLLAALFRWVVV